MFAGQELNMKIAIVGIGAMGGLFAARLALKVSTVYLIEKSPSIIDAVRVHGLRLHDGEGLHVVHPAIGLAADFSEPVDMLLVFTKGFHTRDAIESCRHLVGPSTSVVSLQNGLGNAEILSSVVASQQIVIGVTNHPADLMAPGEIHSCGEGEIRLWSWRNGGDERAKAIAQLLSAAGLTCIADPETAMRVWEKVAFNTALNSICAVTRLDVGAVACSSPGIQLALSIVEEVAAVATASGSRFNTARVEAAIRYAFAHQSAHKPSMLQDIETGRATEVDFISGAVIKSAQSLNVKIPVTVALDSLIRLIEHSSSTSGAA